MSKGKIKVGVFGLNRGMTMVNVLLKHPDAELVAVCDSLEPFRRKCKKVVDQTDAKVTYYDNFDNFFNHDMDAVVLANFANEHTPYACKLLMSGRHVMSEVLPVATLAQAVELVEAVEKSGKVYSYAENYSYFAATQEAKRLYKNGDLGEFMHGEGEYVHCISKPAPELSYGDKTHWRNNSFSTFYCTHSLGPILTITGLRPVKVVGFETPVAPYRKGKSGTSGMEILQLSNGGTVKSLHGGLKREPWSPWYIIYGTKGMIESCRGHESVDRVSLYLDDHDLTETELSYQPRRPMAELATKVGGKGHWGGDFYTTHYFLQKILDRSGGEEIIDVYQALDMGVPGIMAFRSILDGNVPKEVPDFRNKDIREKYRNDHWSTFPNVSPNHLLPRCSFPSPEVPDSHYEEIKKAWEKMASEF